MFGILLTKQLEIKTTLTMLFLFILEGALMQLRNITAEKGGVENMYGLNQGVTLVQMKEQGQMYTIYDLAM